MTNLRPRDDMTFENYSDTLLSQGLFVYPPNKFAFCFIEKNACSTWISTVLLPLLHGVEAPCKTESKFVDCFPEIDWNVSAESRTMFWIIKACSPLRVNKRKGYPLRVLSLHNLKRRTNGMYYLPIDNLEYWLSLILWRVMTTLNWNAEEMTRRNHW